MRFQIPSHSVNGARGAVREAADRIGQSARVPLWGLLPRSIAHEGDILDQYIREGRFQRSLSLIAGLASALSGLEVLSEHYRGSYSQRVMYSPVLLSPALFVAGVWGAVSRRAAQTILPVVSVITVVDGMVGFVFHVRGVARKPGGWRVPIFNVIMGPPVFAPLLFALSGYLGLIATFLRREDDFNRSPGVGIANSLSNGHAGSAAADRSPEETRSPAAPAGDSSAEGVRQGAGAPPTSSPLTWWSRLLPNSVVQEGEALEQHIREGRFQKQLAAAAAISAVFSGVEALYSHYKNNFQYKAQWTPILLTPVLFAAGIGAVRSKRMAHTALPIVSLLALLDGAAGTFYHVRGMLRRPGGLHYPLYNLMYGPPVFAPLLFSASGFLGLLASLLRRAE